MNTFKVLHSIVWSISCVKNEKRAESSNPAYFLNSAGQLLHKVGVIMEMFVLKSYKNCQT